MAKESAKLVAYGFTKKGASLEVHVGKRTVKIEGKTPNDKLKSINTIRKELSDDDRKDFDKAIEGMADHEWAEVVANQMVMTDYPAPACRMCMTMESWHQSIEPFYYWCVNFLGDIGFPVVDKVTDIFTAAEHSSFYGAAGQRLGLAQDKVSQYLATIGKMVKDLFQLVRELRWIDERLEIYREAMGLDKEDKKKGEPQKGAENALKGMWVDLVDGVVGGQRTGSNLFVMAQQLQFTALPDLFFSINPREQKEVDKIVDEQAKEFNEPLRNLLKRKLAQYLAWKSSTYDEMKSRRRFTLDYLRQHYEVIRMYIQWVRPYIKHIERLSGQQDLLNNPRMIAAFESSLVEIEVIGRMQPRGKKGFICVMLTFEYHTKPQMQYPGDAGYHRGPIHVGTTRITWRGYGWSEQQIKNYIAMRNQSDLETLASVDNSLKSAMDALGTDLMNYLEEAARTKKEEKKEERPPSQSLNIFEPFTAVGKGMTGMFGSLIPKGSKGDGGSSVSGGDAARMTWLHYNIFKKAHGLLSW